MTLLLAACPPTDACTPAISMSPDQASWALVLFIIACCVAPFLFGDKR